MCDGGESQDPFAPIREYEETIADIAAGNGPDAHVARVLLASNGTNNRTLTTSNGCVLARGNRTVGRKGVSRLVPPVRPP